MQLAWIHKTLMNVRMWDGCNIEPPVNAIRDTPRGWGHTRPVGHAQAVLGCREGWKLGWMWSDRCWRGLNLKLPLCICYSNIMPLMAIQIGWQVVGQKHLWAIARSTKRRGGKAMVWKSIIYSYLFMSHALKFRPNNNQSLLLKPCLRFLFLWLARYNEIKIH